VELYNLRGQFIADLFNGFLPEGTSRLSLPTLRAGSYLVQMRIGEHLIQTTFVVSN
jgi:hypothetical protein